MTLRALTVATDIKGRLAGSVMAALTLASIGTAALALPAAAATAPAASTADTIRSGPHPARPFSQAPAIGARTANPAVAPRITSSCDSTFHQVAAVNPGMNYNVVSNNGMASLSPTDVWAVGAYGDTITGPDRTLAMQWNGTSWSQVATPNIGASHDDLWGVTSVPGATADVGNVWTVGDYTDGLGVEHAQALQWVTPGMWTQNLPINTGNGNSVLFAVAAVTASNVWAVGNWRQDNGNPPTIPPSPNRTLIGHWDGTAFTIIASPDVSSTSSDRLFSVSASSASDVWAVGRSTEGTVSSNLILHYNGTAWSIVTSPTVGFGNNNTLYGVKAMSPTLAYAVGSYVDVIAGHHHTLLEQWNGAAWSVVTGAELTGGGSDSYLFSVFAASSTDIWAGGAVYTPTNITPSSTLVEHWDGTQWKIVPSVDGNPGAFNELNAILETAPSDIWVGGDYVNPSNVELTLTERLCMSIPTVTGVLPISGNATGGTTVAISGTDFNFASAVKFGATAATSFTINSNTSITATVPAGAAGTVDVTVTNAAGTSAVSPADTYVYVPPAISWQQYWLAGSDGTSWQPIDSTNLSLTFTPTANSQAILSGNADLWTSVPGVNQDVGILVTGGTYTGTGTGTVVAWKESGGFAGTYSPNAAFVQTVIPVASGIQYGARLVWKANKATTGTIFAAAGNAPSFSPTRLTAELVTTPAPNLQSVATNAQYWLPSGGATGGPIDTWQPIDVPNLNMTFTPSANSSAVLSGNADLWTSVAGVNQDLGILVVGGTYGGGTIVGWKESGGFAGTYSPNAAFVQTVIPVAAATQYTVYLAWKANKATTGRIYAAAGNAGAYSPTRLTLRLFPAGTGLQDASAKAQYWKAGSTGSDWTPIDSTNLKLTVVPTANSLYVLSANADLWTATAGVNQDIGIFISGGAYGSGTLVAWKESGGFAGTFSPNAAFVQTVLPLAMGINYTITLEWKANIATGGTIYAAAGGVGNYSPTRITAQLMS